MSEEKRYYRDLRPGLVKFDGKEMKFGNEWIIVPPLNLRLVKRFSAKITALAQVTDFGPGSSDALDSIAEMIHAAIERNYRDIPREEVEDWVDLGNALDCITALLGAMGERIPSQLRMIPDKVLAE